MSVVKVIRPDTGFAQIPNEFAEDLRLSEAAVAVGLFLASRWNDYRFRPEDIRKTFSKRPGKTRGRDWWRRVSNELESAGYMRLTVSHGTNGRFVSEWSFCVIGFPEDDPDGGSAAAGSADSGEPAVGSADSGTPDTYTQQGFSQEGFTQHETTTTRAMVSGGASEKSSWKTEELMLDRYIAAHRDDLAELLGNLPLGHAQDIADELAGAMHKASLGERPPIGSVYRWVKSMVKRLGKGDFKLELGKAIRATRAEQLAEASRLSKERESASRNTELSRACIRQGLDAIAKGKRNLHSKRVVQRGKDVGSL